MKGTDVTTLVNELNSFTPGKDTKYYRRLYAGVAKLMYVSVRFTLTQQTLIIHVIFF